VIDGGSVHGGDSGGKGRKPGFAAEKAGGAGARLAAARPSHHHSGVAQEVHVKIRDLLKQWKGARQPRLTAETYAIRLPVEDAARVHALAEMFPDVPEEDLLRDLLGAALSELEAAMPYEPGPRIASEDDFGDPVYEDAGPTPRFLALTRKHKERLAPEG
jgi:hypothetical protein